jgi:hypothetical protein
MVEAYGIPQALTWNIGTTGSTESCSLIPRPSAVARAIECREMLRCEYRAPFGLPVVPEV